MNHDKCVKEAATALKVALDGRSGRKPSSSPGEEALLIRQANSGIAFPSFSAKGAEKDGAP
jgi:hypothetical protein